MAAITGFESNMRVGPMGPSPASLSALGRPAAIAFKSAPAQKFPPAPVSTATSNVSSASNARKASASAAAVAASTALRASGRLMVTVRMAAARLVSTDGISIHVPLAEPGDLVAQSIFERTESRSQFPLGLRGTHIVGLLQRADRFGRDQDRRTRDPADELRDIRESQHRRIGQ